MSNGTPASTTEIVVSLVQPGVPAREIHLSEGATHADLLKATAHSADDRRISIQGVPIEEALTLSDGLVVTIVPRASNGKGNEPWRAVSVAFRDNPLFEEYLAILKANRLEEYPEEEPAE